MTSSCNYFLNPPSVAQSVLLEVRILEKNNAAGLSDQWPSGCCHCLFLFSLFSGSGFRRDFSVVCEEHEEREDKEEAGDDDRYVDKKGTII